MSASATTETAFPTPRRGPTRRGASQGILGAGAVILGIVGLAMPAAQSNVPNYLDAIAGLILGLILLAIGLGISASYARLLSADANSDDGSSPLAVMTADTFMGAAIIILGILAILSVATEVLIAIQVILFGSGLLLSAVASVRLANIENAISSEPTLAQRLTAELALATASVRMAAGVAVLVLGILAVTGTQPIDLTLVAMIIGGAAVLLNANAVGGRLVGSMLR